MGFVFPTALLLLCVTWQASADKGCPSNWYRYDQKCYGFYYSWNYQWKRSHSMCKSHGWTMASPRTHEEKQWLHHVIKEKATDYWIGLRRVNGKWVWPDNMPYQYDYRDWVVGSPSAGKSEMCAHASPCTGGKWKEAPCTLYKKTLCYFRGRNGQWGAWAPWSACSKKCGTGRQSRTRQCNLKIDPGLPCPGYLDDYRHCNTQYCPTGWGTCTVGGDPHYFTFDLQGYNFQGGDLKGRECKFFLAGRCKEPSPLPPFKILASNDHRGQPHVSWIKAIELHYNGHVIRVDQSHRSTGLIYVDGIRRSSDNYRGVPEVVVTKVGQGVRLSIEEGLVYVTFNGYRTVVVGVDKCLKGKQGLCGLCGNYDGNKANDLYLRNGTASRNRNHLGWSYQEPGQYGRYCHNEHFSPCDTTNCPLAQKCNILSNTGVFGTCPRYYNAKSGCAIDMCCSKQRPDKCRIFRDYARECFRLGYRPRPTWEKDCGCGAHTCPANSNYDPSANACQKTCTGVIDGCMNVYRRGACVCRPRYVWFNNRCIPKRTCGCADRRTGEVHAIGSSWLDKCCKTKYHCRKGKNGHSVIETSKNKCHPAARCSLVRGRFACTCSPGFTGSGNSCNGFTCPSKIKRLYQDPLACKKYYYCIRGQAQHHTCSGPLLFDIGVQGCILKDVCLDSNGCAISMVKVVKRQAGAPKLSNWIGDGKFNCPRKDGAFPNKGSCTQFYVCREGVAIEGVCEEGMHFSSSKSKCMTKEKAGCQQ